MSSWMRVLAALPLAGLASADPAAVLPDISSLLVLTLQGIPAAADASTFEDDIEDPVPPELPGIDELMAEAYPPSDSVLEPPVPGLTSGDRKLRSMSGRASPQMGGVSPISFKPMSPPSSHKTSSGRRERKNTPPRQRKPMAVLGFIDAKRAFDSALRNAELPFQVRWFAGGVFSRMKEPKKAEHAQFLASLLQAGGYGLRCAGEFRRLRHIDQGRVSTHLQEIQTLRTRSIACVLPIKTFLAETIQRLGGPLREKGAHEGWDRAASLLEALLASSIAMEKNFLALTKYLEAKCNPKTPSHVLLSLKEERDKAKADYDAAKGTMKAEAIACEEKGLIPKVVQFL